jgi:nicotinamidase-related amidase
MESDGRFLARPAKTNKQAMFKGHGPGLHTLGVSFVATEADAGGQWRPERAPKAGDVIIDKHRGQSGFANTILDCQLQQHRSSYAVGLAAHTCAESTARFAMQLGCHRTLLEDAPSAYKRGVDAHCHEITCCS